MLLGQAHNPAQFRLNCAHVLKPCQHSWQHHFSATTWLSVCANKDLVPWLQWMINSVSLVAMWTLCLHRLVLPALGAEYSFPLPLLTVPEMWLMSFREGFCWRWHCWRVRFAPTRMGVTMHEAWHWGLHMWWTSVIKWRAVSEWLSMSTMCFVTANDVTGCTQSLQLTTLSGACTPFGRQGFSGTCLLLAKHWGACDAEAAQQQQQQQHDCYIWVTQKRTCRTWGITGAVT